MQKTTLIAALLAVTAMPAIGAVVRPTLIGVDSENDPRAKEAYAFQCNEWAQKKTFADDNAKTKSIQDCTSSMAQVWPLGADDSDTEEG